MISFFANARNALAFLSRLTSPASHDVAALAAAVPFYPLAGAVLGVLAALPSFFFAPTAAWSAAWIYVLLLAWLTRGLHWDGLADLADACGGNTSGERFWEIMKDSRIGAFGTMTITLGMGGQIIATQHCLEAGAFQALILAPAFGRAAAMILGKLTRPSAASTLGKLTHSGMRSVAASISCALTLAAAAICVLPSAVLAAVLLTAVSTTLLVRIASRSGGANGDFYGAAIITGETAFLLACA